MANQTPVQRRKDNPRIDEIEAEIGRLTTELLGLVSHTEDELQEQREAVYEDMRDCGPDGVSDIDAIVYLLDQRDMEAE